MKSKKIHRGEALKKAIKESDYTIALATKRAGFVRQSYYQHIAKADLGYDVLHKYGKAIGHDFGVEFPEMANYISEVDEPIRRFATLEEATLAYQRLERKYVKLLERFHDLDEKK